MSSLSSDYHNPRPKAPPSWKSVAWVVLGGLALLLSSLQGATLSSAILFTASVGGFCFSEWIDRNRFEHIERIEQEFRRDLKKIEKEFQDLKDLVTGMQMQGFGR